MATESADGPEVTVTLPPSLEEWLTERADALGTDREELLVQLAGAYRAAAEAGDGVPWASGHETTPVEAVEREAFEELRERVDDLASKQAEDIQDVRTRVLQLKETVGRRAPRDHQHEEFDAIADLEGRTESLARDLEDVGTEVADLSEDVARRGDRLADVESKLDRLAGVVLQLRDGDDADGDDDLETLLEAANRHRVSVARCGSCGHQVQLALLRRAACPDCETAFRELEEPSSGVAGWLDPRKPRLLGPEPPALEAPDE